MCPISINLTHTIAVGVNEEVLRLTKLRDEIYVICQPTYGPILIRVFEDIYPYRLQRKFEINEIGIPADIVSSEKDNCLYVLDRDEACIWKIARETTGQRKILKWVVIGDFDQPSLSMSSNGQLLVLNYKSRVLMICESYEKLLSAIQSPKGIEDQHYGDIKLSETALFFDIESRATKFYFFGSDQMWKSEWNRIEERGHVQNIVKWLTTDRCDPSALSLSNFGKVLVVTSPSSILIYGSEAECVSFIKSPRGSENQHHAETGIKELKLSSGKENCLYVSDQTVKCVWKIRPIKETAGDRNICKWLTVENCRPGPSAWRDPNFGSLLPVKAVSYFLMIYGSDAELKRSIPLPNDIAEPRHAVETSIGNFVMFHNYMETEKTGEGESTGRRKGKEWVVSELTGDGQVIRRFTPSNGLQKLSYYSFLSLDSDDRVFVADKDNEKVTLFDSDLKWNRILCPTEVEKGKEKVIMPDGMFYDERKKQLIVGGLMDQEFGVNIYTLSGI